MIRIVIDILIIVDNRSEYDTLRKHFSLRGVFVYSLGLEILELIITAVKYENGSSIVYW